MPNNVQVMDSTGLIYLAVAADGSIKVTGMGASVGQKTMANSSPVVIASDQSALTVFFSPATSASTIVYAASLVVKATPGTLYGFSVYNSKASAQWIQVHNATALPSNTAVPIITLVVAATSNLGVSFGPRGLTFGTGITIGNSTTGPTLTTGSADCWISAEYV